MRIAVVLTTAWTVGVAAAGQHAQHEFDAQSQTLVDIVRAATARVLDPEVALGVGVCAEAVLRERPQRRRDGGALREPRPRHGRTTRPGGARGASLRVEERMATLGGGGIHRL